MQATTASHHVLAVDLGTGGPKVALVSTAGTVVASTQSSTELLLLPGGGAEQDPEAWWTEIVRGARTVLAESAVDASSVVAVSVSTQWMGTVPVGANGRHLANAIIWMDSRGAPYSQRIAGGGLEVPGTGYNARRLQRWLSITGGVPSRTGKDPVGHIAYLRNERPEIYEAATCFLEPMDYLNLRLTGIAAASWDTVVGYWCTDNRDLRDVRYVEQLVHWAQIDAAKLPELRPTGTVLGPLTAEAAAELGLSTTVQVVMGSGDTASAAVGSGAVRDLDAHLYIGTSSWLSCHVPFKRTDILRNVTSLPSGIPGRYWSATEQDVAGKAMSWLIEQMLWADDEVGGAPPPDALERVNQLAARAPAGAGGLFFMPWLNGERTPVDDRWIRGGWLNASLHTDRAALVRSVFEGVALNSRWMLQAVERFVRQDLEQISFVGGGAQSELWCQIHADVLGRTIVQVEDPVMANVRGAGMMAAVALGHLTWDDVASRTAVRATYEPNRQNAATYNLLFDSFTKTYKGTKRMYAGLNRVLQPGG